MHTQSSQTHAPSSSFPIQKSVNQLIDDLFVPSDSPETPIFSITDPMTDIKPKMALPKKRFSGDSATLTYF
jgi:hypothetical protein